MKNVKLFLSLALFSVAIAGAFTASKSKAVVTTVPGYIKQGPNCEQKNECSVETTLALCTETNTGGAYVFGMDSSLDCTVELWRIHN